MIDHNRTESGSISAHTLFFVLVGNLLLCGCGAGGEKARSGKSEKPPVPVIVAQVVQKDVPVEIRTFGTIEPSVSVVVKPQITGILTAIKFIEGQDILKDDILFVIDPIPFENELNKAEANLSKSKIQFDNAKKEALRQAELLKKGLTAEDFYDQAKTSADALEAMIKSEEATVENARIQLGYCTIRAPVNGKTGKYFVDPGNLIKANETTLITINQIKPVKAVFTVPEQNLAGIIKQMAAGKIETKAFLPDTTGSPETGLLTFIDNTVDRSTGSINLKAVFQNEGKRLWPGQFVQIAVVLSLQTNAIVAPSEAIQTGQKGTYVYVIRPNMFTENRQVKVARQLDDIAVISEGLNPGELVVIEGQQRIGGLDSKVEIRSASTNTTSTNK